MNLDRRQFVTALVFSGAAAAAPIKSIEDDTPASQVSLPNPQNANVDFRYAPHHQQSTICFPDDPKKTVVGQAGDLRYGFGKSLSAGMENFNIVVSELGRKSFVVSKTKTLAMFFPLPHKCHN